MGHRVCNIVGCAVLVVLYWELCVPAVLDVRFSAVVVVVDVGVVVSNTA